MGDLSRLVVPVLSSGEVEHISKMSLFRFGFTGSQNQVTAPSPAKRGTHTNNADRVNAEETTSGDPVSSSSTSTVSDTDGKRKRTRNFLPQGEDGRPWLLFENDVMFCKPCKLSCQV